MIDGNADLIPLPQRADPDAVLTIDLKLASTNSTGATRVSVAAPIVDAPVMLAQWKLEPDEGQRLAYLNGSLTPVGGLTDVSGFAQLARLFKGDQAGRALTSLVASLLLLLLALLVWRWTVCDGVYKFSMRHIFGAAIGLAAVVLASIAIANLVDGVGLEKSFAPRNVTFLAPVQQAGSALTAEVANLAETASTTSLIGTAWPGLLALVVWIYGWPRTGMAKTACRILGWTLLAWAALRWPNGAAVFFAGLAAFLFLNAVIPALKRLWQLPKKPQH